MGGHPLLTEAVEDAFGKREVHPAHEVAMVVDQGMERAVSEAQRPRLLARLVPTLIERLDECLATTSLRRLRTRRDPRRRPDFLPHAMRRLLERGHRSLAGRAVER